MEHKPSQTTPTTPTRSEWPPVPPAPTLVKPQPAPAPPEPVLGAASAAPPAMGPRGPAPVPTPSAVEAAQSPLLRLQHTVRRQQAQARDPRQDLVWQPRFAYTSALVIMLALTVVSMPLWIVLYRITFASSGGAPSVADVVALCMMLLGGLLTAAAAWVIIIEMRGRVRMVDTLARTGEREIIAPAAPEIPMLDAPLEQFMRTERIGAGRGAAQPAKPAATHPATHPAAEAAWDPAWDPSTAATGAALPRADSLPARVEAAQVSAAATLEASSKLLSAFSGVLKSFGQLTAQVAMLAVALALFVGATVLSLNAGAP